MAMIFRQTKRSGYVLVLTLTLVALAALSLAGLARYSLSLTSEAQQSVEELQRRWGLASVRHMLFDRAGQIVAAQVPVKPAQKALGALPSRALASFTLSGFRFTVIVADEDAKANLNVLYARRPEQALTLIRRLNQDRVLGVLTVRLKPQQDSRAPFSSWGQVFDLVNTSSPENVPAQLMAASEQVTCWGSGRVNLRRASDAVLRETVGSILTTKQTGELIELRNQGGELTVDAILDQLELRGSKRATLGRLLATESSRYSLWVTIDNSQRTWSYQYVNDGGPVCFAW